ncbi:MAG: hypothetical protein AB7L94_40855 [Kofleriaceae bacterium]
MLLAKPMRLMFMVILVAACGGGATRGPTTSSGTLVTPALEPQVGELHWYRAVSTCAQGPFEVELPVTGNKYGEEVELRVATPRKIALHAVVVVDGAELAKDQTTIDRDGRASGAPDNAKCIADARERLVLGRTGGGGGTTTPGTPIVPKGRVPDAPATETPAVQLERTGEPDYTVPSTLIHVRLPDTVPAGARVRIRFWSIEPNDLTGVLFGAVRIAWRPNVGDEAYEAYLRDEEARRIRFAEEQEAKRLREAEKERLRAERARLAMEEARKNYRPPPVDPEELRRARERAEREERERAEREERERRRAEEAARRRAIEAALEADRARRRREWCDAHPESRDCWGAGGYKVHAELIARGDERERYCAANKADARCWTDSERAERTAAWKLRVSTALQPPKPPDGPPPAALADPQPPSPSENAEWRPGYWHWIDGTWVWLAGQWRVPERDLAEEKTAQAPSAPPPPQVETIAVAPAPAVIWVPGYWMWNRTQWIWVPGSWQMRPSARVRWRAPEWRVRGTVHVFVPGGWIR